MHLFAIRGRQKRGNCFALTTRLEGFNAIHEDETQKLQTFS